MKGDNMTLTELFTQIANAIRSKTGGASKIAASDFASEISNIDTSQYNVYVNKISLGGYSSTTVSIPFTPFFAGYIGSGNHMWGLIINTKTSSYDVWGGGTSSSSVGGISTGDIKISGKSVYLHNGAYPSTTTGYLVCIGDK